MSDVLRTHETKHTEDVHSHAAAHTSRQQFQDMATTPSSAFDKPNTAQQALPDLQIDMGGESTTRKPQPQNVETTATQSSTQKNP